MIKDPISTLRLIQTDATNADFQGLVALLDRELSIRDGEEYDFYYQFNKIDALRHVVVAYMGEQPVGCGAFKPYDAESVEIKRMYVLDDWRSRGIAAQVLQLLEKWANAEGYSRFVLETGLKQPEAIRLYQKSGYVSIPNYGQYVGVENSICMEKCG